MTSGDLTGRTALVTGAAGSMGRSIALLLARAGADVVLNDRSEEVLAETSAHLRQVGGQVASIGADVTDMSAVREMVHAVTQRFGAVDILINNAGVLRPTRFLDISVDEWEFVVGVNLTGVFNCSQAVVPGMQDSGWGRIVNISSTAGKSVSTMGGAHYTTSKAGVLGLTRALAKEVAADGITVNAVCPGLIDTDMTRATISEQQANAYAQSFPIPRLGRPDEVAELVGFLASDRAAYVTGASLDITGGDLMI